MHCPRAPGGLYAPAGRAGDTFTVPVAVWTVRAQPAQVGLRLGRPGRYRRASGASWSDRALRSPRCVRAVRADTVF